MRLHFTLSAASSPIDFNYNALLTQTLHRWLGNNNSYHNGLSLYSVGNLQGGRAHNGALWFRSGARWHISAPDTSQGEDFLHQVADAATRSPNVCHGMEVFEVAPQSTPDFGTQHSFRAESPIFIRGDKEGDLDPHILFDNPRANDYLTRTLRHKLDKAGLSHLSENARVEFDLSYPAPKTRLIRVKENFDKAGERKDFCKRASVCPVIVSGDAQAVQFAWCCGAGNLTGLGFGSLV